MNMSKELSSSKVNEPRLLRLIPMHSKNDNPARDPNVGTLPLESIDCSIPRTAGPRQGKPTRCAEHVSKSFRGRRRAPSISRCVMYLSLFLLCRRIFTGRSSARCSDSPNILSWCTSCKFRGSLPSTCARDVAFGRSGTGADSCSVLLPECEYDSAGVATLNFSQTIDMAYVISFKKQPELVEKVARVLGRERVHVISAVNGSTLKSSTATPLTAGELGIMASAVVVMQHALKRGYSTVMVFEDDVLLRNHFEDELSRLASDASCTCFLKPDSGCPAGLLMLGGTVIGNADIFNSWEDEKKVKNRQCVNFIRGTWGMFANVYNTRLFPHIMEWIQDEGKILPVDAMYTFLARRGFVVRVAYPFLTMALMNTSSTVQSESKQSRFETPQSRADWYYKMNRWEIEDFY